MRTSTGLGLIAIVGLVACATTETVTMPGEGNASGDPGVPDDNTSQSGDGQNPSDPAKADPTNPEAPPGPVLPNIAITDVAVFQAVKVPVVTGGAVVKPSARNAPVVANRPGLVRVYVKPAAGFKAQDVTAELRLVGDDGTKFPLVKETKRISAASTDEDPKTTFNLEIPATSVPVGVTFQVSLTGAGGEDVGANKSDGRFPRDGSFQTLDPEVSGKLKVVVVPVKYDADGSGRVPDVSASQLEVYRKMMMSRYPASDVEISVRAPYSWTTVISRNGSGFNNVLSAMHQLRQADKVAKDVYYYGALAPSSSFNTFCQSGCVTGLSTVVDDPNTAVMRASVGIGYAGLDSANTMAHEVGHAHGREHAPCGGTSGVDPDYPYSGAVIGVWGYDIFAKTLISPTKGHDMMGYCPNEWVSDYTYSALFDRIAAVSLSKNVVVPHSLNTASGIDSIKKPASYRVATVLADGSLEWTNDIDLDEELTGGDVRPARFLDKNGVELITRSSRFYRFDHLPGGFLFVPKEAKTDWTTVIVNHKQLSR